MGSAVRVAVRGSHVLAVVASDLRTGALGLCCGGSWLVSDAALLERVVSMDTQDVPGETRRPFLDRQLELRPTRVDCWSGCDGGGITKNRTRIKLNTQHADNTCRDTQ